MLPDHSFNSKTASAANNYNSMILSKAPKSRAPSATNETATGDSGSSGIEAPGEDIPKTSKSDSDTKSEGVKQSTKPFSPENKESDISEANSESDSDTESEGVRPSSSTRPLSPGPWCKKHEEDCEAFCARITIRNNIDKNIGALEKLQESKFPDSQRSKT